MLTKVSLIFSTLLHYGGLIMQISNDFDAQLSIAIAGDIEVDDNRDEQDYLIAYANSLPDRCTVTAMCGC